MNCISRKIENRNIQFLIENMTQCGGNCSGCALSSSERMNNDSYSEEKLKYNLHLFHDYIANLSKTDEIESISLFLGQGDHFLLSDDSLKKMLTLIGSSFINKSINHKTVIFLTASAIGKHQEIVRKMNIIYDFAQKYQLSIFIQVVFDPKKYKSHNKNFCQTYLKNILHFKKICGMVELTINIGEDFLKYLSPEDMHEIMIKNEINHLEINWVLNEQTLTMWQKNHLEMYQWLENLIHLKQKDKKYEINFLPFLGRAFKKMNIEGVDIISYIEELLQNHIYMNQDSSYSFGLPGLFNNLTPLIPRNHSLKTIFFKTNQIKKETAFDFAKKIYQKSLKNDSCVECEFKNSCMLIGATQWNEFEGNEGCHWHLYEFLTKMKKLDEQNHFVTLFNENPHTKGISLNETQDFKYFKKQFD